MQRLLVMRHANSGFDVNAPSDYVRPLSDSGFDDALQMGERIESADWVPDEIVCSPATRAATTALHVASAWDKGADAIRFDQSIYGAEVDHLLASLRSVPNCKTAIIVGHNPGMSKLVEGLTGAPIPTGADGKTMPPATVAAIALGPNGIELGAGKLEWIIRPGDE